MKKLFATLGMIFMFASCETDLHMLGSTTISNEITSDYLLDGNLDIYLDNQQVFRYKGKPGIEVIPIGSDVLPEYEACFILRIATGAESAGNVTAAKISVDGQSILNASDFEDTFITFEFEICHLSIDSYMEIEILGQPGTYLDIWIEGKKKDQIPEGSLVAYYPFNGNANDESGNGHNGTEFGTLSYTADRFGNPFKALEINGDGYINCGVDPISNNESVSFAAWCFPYSTHQGYILASGGQTHSVGYAIAYEKGPYYLGRQTENLKASTLQIGHLENNQWQFLVGVYDKSTQKLKVYKNGEPVDVFDPIASTLTNDFADLIIGKPNNTDRYKFHGKIDDVMIFNYPIDDVKVTELYQQGGWSGN